jgi:putative MFS transporter
MARFGARMRAATQRTGEAAKVHLTGLGLAGKLAALSIAALSWGLVNFGLLLWLPTDLVAKGYSVELSSRLLAESSLIALPTVFAAAWLYSRWSTKWSVVASLVITIAGLFGVLALEIGLLANPVLPVALMIVGTNGLIAMVLPYTAETFPVRVRARATGWVAACTKAGGVGAQFFAILALVPALGVSAALIAAPTALALLLLIRFGRETRGRDLRELDRMAEVEPA